MLELNLHVDEKIFRDSYQVSYKNTVSAINEEFERKKFIQKILLGLVILFSSLTILDFTWGIYLMLALLSLLLYKFSLENIKLSTISSIRKKKKVVEDYISSISQLKKISFAYNQGLLKYYEDDQLIQQFEWSTLKYYFQDDKAIYVGLREPEIQFLIPKALAMPQELMTFDSFMKQKVRELKLGILD